MKQAIEGIYINGSIEFLEEVPFHKTMKVIVVFTEEIEENNETRNWLKLAESAFDFWDNEEDEYYDKL